MKKQPIFWAIAFGSMLAISGCGDENDGSGGTAGGDGGGGTSGTSGTGGGGNSGFCGTLCQACSGGQTADCASACESYISGGAIGGIDLNQCPSEAQAWGACLGANDCNDAACNTEINAWATCLFTP